MLLARAASVALLASLAAADDVAALAARLSTDRASEAADRLAELGPSAKAAVPQLIAALGHEDPELRWRAAWALSRMGPAAAAAAPALVPAVLGEDGLTASAACIALKRTGRAATDAVLAAVEQAPEGERARYLRMLAAVETDPERLIPVLLPFLRSPDITPCLNACHILADMGDKAAPAVPALIARFKEDDFPAGRVLVAIGAPAVGPLRDLAMDAKAEESLRGKAIGLLAQIPGPGVSAAAACLEEATDDIWFWAAMALRDVGPGAAELVPLIERQVARMEDTILDLGSLARALAAMGPKGEAALERLLFTSSDDRRADLVERLGRVKCGKTVSWLLRLADASEPPEIRFAAMKALARARVRGEDARRAAQIAERELEGAPYAACELARSLGPAAAHLADKLRPLVESKSQGMRAIAASALCAIGKGTDADAALIAAAVREAAAEPGRAAKRATLECLGWAGAPAAPHWGLLRDALAAEDFGERLGAAESLSRLLPVLGDDKWNAIHALRSAETLIDLSCIDDPETLVELLADEMTSFRAPDRLVELGARCKPALTAALDAEDPRVRGLAASVLLQIDVRGAGERAWLAALPWAREIADICRAHPQVAIPHLMAALQASEPSARGAAAYLLGELAYRDAIKGVRRLVANDPVPDIRAAALRALDRLLAAP